MLGCGIWTRTCSGGREGEERGGGGGDVDMIDFISAFPFGHDFNFLYCRALKR